MLQQQGNSGSVISGKVGSIRKIFNFSQILKLYKPHQSLDIWSPNILLDKVQKLKPDLVLFATLPVFEAYHEDICLWVITLCKILLPIGCDSNLMGFCQTVGFVYVQNCATIHITKFRNFMETFILTCKNGTQIIIILCHDYSGLLDACKSDKFAQFHNAFRLQNQQQ